MTSPLEPRLRALEGLAARLELRRRRVVIVPCKEGQEPRVQPQQLSRDAAVRALVVPLENLSNSEQGVSSEGVSKGVSTL